MKILIVDDDEIDRRNLVRLLSRNQSFDITALEETKSLFEQPPATLFDAVILDYHMPDMDGLEVFSKLKSYDSFRESSVLFVSNNEDDSVAEKCIENGAHDFMLKSDLNASRIKRAILLARKRRELEYAVQSSFHKIKYLAEHDTLTSLYNRNTFEKHMERACLQAAFLPFYLVVIDLDGFSSFNDMYGSKVGDLVIMETASRIKQFFGTEQLVARTGNDEFAVIVHQKVFRDDIKSQLLKLSGCLSGQINSSKINTQCTFSIGVSSLVSEFRAEEQVLKEARLSVETGRKKRHASIVYFDKALVEKQNKQQLIQLGIDHHLSENEFNLVFQPIFCKEGALKGVETLIRWPEHSDFGQYSPAEFIPEAESNHQIVELGSWIAKHAIQSLAQIHQNSHLNLFLTINISAVQLDTKTLGDSYSVIATNLGCLHQILSWK